MRQVFSVSELRVGDIIKEVDTVNGHWWISEIFQVGGKVALPSFTAQLLVDYTGQYYKDYFMYPNPCWFTTKYVAIYVLNH